MIVGYRVNPKLILFVVLYFMSYLMKTTSADVDTLQESLFVFKIPDNRVYTWSLLSEDVGCAAPITPIFNRFSGITASDDRNIIATVEVEDRFFGHCLVSNPFLVRPPPLLNEISLVEFVHSIAPNATSYLQRSLIYYYQPLVVGSIEYSECCYVFSVHLDIDDKSWRYFLFVRDKRLTVADYYVSYGSIVNSVFSVFLCALLICEFVLRSPPNIDQVTKIQFDLSYLNDMRWWRKKLKEYYPGREFTLARERKGILYCVSLRIKVAVGSVTYSARSRHCYADALLTLAARLPNNDAEEIKIHGILDFCGLPETLPIKFLKFLVFFCYNFRTARTRAQKFMAILQWLDSVHELAQKMNLNPVVGDIIKVFMSSEELRDTLNSDINYDLDVEDEIGNSPITNDVKIHGLAETASAINSFLKGVVNSSSVRALLRLIALVWHVLFIFKDGKIDWDHLTRWDTVMFNSIPEKALNLGQVVLEQLQNLVSCSYEFYKTRDITVFLRNDNEVTKFLEEVEVLSHKVKQYPLTDTITPEMANFEVEIRDAIERGENLRPKVKLSVRPAFTSGLFQLRSLAIEVSTMARSCSSRPAPFSVLITGPPKIGKANITSLIAAQFRATNPLNKLLNNSLDLPVNGIYTRTLKEEYWSCYMNSHWCVIYDDLGQTNPKCAEFSLEVNEIIQVVNNAAFFPNMAGVDEKGKRYVAPQLVIATANNRDLNAAHAVRSPAAVLRRFPFVVTPKLRECFKTDNVLDPKKTLDYADLWTFTVEEVILSNNSHNNGVSYRVIKQDVSTREFLQWIDCASTAHYKGQIGGNKFLTCINRDKQCEACKCLSIFCSCKQMLQAYSPEFSFVSSFENGAECYYVSQAENVTNGPREGSKIISIDGFRITGTDSHLHNFKKLFYGEENSLVYIECEGAVGIIEKYEFHRTRPNLRRQELEPRVDQIHAESKHKSFSFFQLCQKFMTFWMMTQCILASFCLYRISCKPVSWFLALFLHRYRVMNPDGFMRMNVFNLFARNMIDFNWLDNWSFYWMLGWDSMASRCRRSWIQAKNKLVENPKIVVAIGSALVCSAFVIWYYSMMTRADSKCDINGQESSIPQGVPPPPADANIDNTWKAAGPLTFTSFLTSTSRTGSPDYLRSVLDSSFACISIDTTKVTIRGFNIFGQYWLLPRHYVVQHWSGATTLTLTRSKSYASPNFGSHVCQIDMKCVTLCPDEDFALVRLGVPPGPNLLPYLTKFPKGSRFEGLQAMIRQGQGAVLHPTGPVSLIETQISKLTELNAFPSGKVYSIFEYKSIFETKNGDCGSPLVILEKGRTLIAGVHVGVRGLDETIKMVVPMPTEWLTKIYHEDQRCIVQGDISFSRPDGSEFTLKEAVHDKCPLRFEGISDTPNGSSVTPLGEIQGIAQNRFASKVALNKFHAFWTGLGYVTNKVKPKFGPDTCKSWLPKRNFLVIASQHKDTMRPEMIKQCSTHYFNRLVRGIPQRSLRKVVIIDEDTNLYGAESNSFISHINFGSGAGFPYNKPKFEVMVPCAREGFNQGTFGLSDFTRKRINDAEFKLSQGVRPNFVFNASLKDEPISLPKLAAGKIRVFMAICLEGLFLLRKYFLSLIALFQTFNFVTEAAIGMDATGPDWDDIHDYLYPDEKWKVFCGDYSNYDQRMSGALLMAAWQILIDLAKLSGNYPTVALRIMFGLAIECVYVLVNFFGDLLILNGTNPSGHALTVVINSICNSLYMRYAWLSIFGTLDGFDEYVRLMTYGDDNCVSVHEKYQDKFNQVTVTAALAAVGVVYTDAKKTGEAAPPFCEPDDVSFLKRGFRKTTEGFWAAPLEVASIEKMLIIGVQSSKVQEGDRLASVLISSVMEAFQHEPEYFHQHRARVVECAQLYGLTEWVEAKGGLPSYELLLERRLAKVSRKGLLFQVLNQRTPAGIVTSEDINGEFTELHGGCQSESRGANPQNHVHGGASAVRELSCQSFDKCTTIQGTSLAKTNSKQSLFRFFEKDSGEKVGYRADDDPTIAKTDRGAYVDFFSRPIQLAQYSWSENTSYPTTFMAPWHDYFTKPIIWSKLQGFSRLRATLKLKFVVNGSPFRYGEAMVSYRPLFQYDAGSYNSGTWQNAGQPMFSGGDISGDNVNNLFYMNNVPNAQNHDASTIMARSQRMNIKISPQTNSGGEMTIPFIYYKDAIPLLDGQPVAGSATALALREMGTLVIENIVDLLSTAVANASPVTVTLFAWAEDVEVWGPTSSTIVVQGEDENADATKPSYVASAVADSARALSKVPIIGPYAMATSFAADAVSKILKFFGWSNPPILTGVMGQVPKTSFLNPNPRMSYADEVVALDGKNEVTVDPRTVGVPPVDELCIQSFCKKPCIFDTFLWKVTDDPASAIATLPVMPTYFRSSWVNNPTGDFDCARVTMSPACYAAQLFSFWRGTFCIRLRVVCSQFHRGRLLVSWDPNPSYGNNDGKAGQQISDVLDLASANELVFKVPFMSHIGMLNVNNLAVNCSTQPLAEFQKWGNRSTTTGWTKPVLYQCANGIVFVNVLNELQCGDATADATIVAECWMEDMHFACPRSDIQSGSALKPSGTISGLAYSNVVVQGVEVPDGESVSDEVSVYSADEHLAKLYSGESVPSLRVLLHRTYFWRNNSFVNNSSLYGHLITYAFARFPLPLHALGFGHEDKTPIPSGGTEVTPTNFYNTTPIAYLTSCFTGYRGSIVWKSATSEAYLGRGAYFSALCKGGNPSKNGIQNLSTGNSAADSARKRQLSANFGSILGGAAASFQSSNGVCSGLFPMYSNWRMFPGNVNKMYDSQSQNGYDHVSLSSDVVTWAGITSAANQVTDLLLSVAAGTDYNVFGFVNIPDVYVQDSF